MSSILFIILWHGSSEGFKAGDTWLYLTFGWQGNTSHTRCTLDSLLVENGIIRGAIFHIIDSSYNYSNSPNDTMVRVPTITEEIKRYSPGIAKIPCFPDLIRYENLEYLGMSTFTSINDPVHYLINGELRQLQNHHLSYYKFCQDYFYGDDLGLIYGYQDNFQAALNRRIQLIQFNGKAISFEKVQNVGIKVSMIKIKPGISSKIEPAEKNIAFYNLQGRLINRKFQQNKISGLEIIQKRQNGKPFVYVNLSKP